MAIIKNYLYFLFLANFLYILNTYLVHAQFKLSIMTIF